MAIVNMNRFALFTFERHKDALMKALQSFGQVHFRKLSPDEFAELAELKRNAESAAASENDLARVTYAIGRLKPYVSVPKGLKAMTAPPTEMTFGELDAFTEQYDFADICEGVRVCDERIKAAQAESQRLKAENDGLRAWSAFTVAPAMLDQFRQTRWTVGAAHKNAADALEARLASEYPAAYVQRLHAAKDDVLFLIIAAADEWDAVNAGLKELGFSRTTLNFTGVPSEKAAENEKRIAALAAESDAALAGLKAFAPHYERLLTAADTLRTAMERARVCENFLNLSDVLVMEGWTPAERMPALRDILESVCPGEYYCQDAPAERDAADVPIALKNNQFAQAFEDVTSMFALPKYNEIDPTPLLAPFYVLFFGLMVGDFGYGLVLLLGTALALKFLHLKESMRRFMKFFFYLSFGVLLAGFLYGGFFGFQFPPFLVARTPEGLPKAILSSDYDILIMLIMSVAIGVVQVLFGFCVKAYMSFRDKKPGEAIMDSILWIVTLVSGLGMLGNAAPDVVPAALLTVFKFGFFGGLIALFLTQGRSSPSIGGKIGNGLMGVYNITGYMGDLISYSRLTAIALSGTYIASSFNMMAGMIPGPMKFIFGTAIFLLGNTLNMGLGYLGAYVHGARLQFVEFFGKFYEGGGVPFKPFSPKNVFIKLRETYH